MKRHLFWVVELFIWLLILFVAAGGIMIAKYNYRKNFNTYQIFLPDVDGLINGSPVKFMGIDIGYVNQIDIVGDDVYVKFIVTKSDVRIPHGAITTVEFSGLGGSKSLEIYPPISVKNISDKILITQSPKRIHDSLGLLNDMFDKIIDLTYEVSHFMNQIGVIKGKEACINPEVPKSAGEFLKFSNDWLDRAQKQSDKIADKLNGRKGKKNEQQQNQSN